MIVAAARGRRRRRRETHHVRNARRRRRRSQRVIRRSDHLAKGTEVHQASMVPVIIDAAKPSALRQRVAIRHASLLAHILRLLPFRHVAAERLARLPKRVQHHLLPSSVRRVGRRIRNVLQLASAQATRVRIRRHAQPRVVQEASLHVTSVEPPRRQLDGIRIVAKRKVHLRARSALVGIVVREPRHRQTLVATA